MIETQEHIDERNRSLFYKYIEQLGGYIKFKKPIKFRETPHSKTKYITELSENDDFDSYGSAKDTILQVLRYELYKNQ